MRPQAALFSGGAGLLLLLLVSYCASPRIGLGRGEASIAMADEGSPEFSNWVAKWYGQGLVPEFDEQCLLVRSRRDARASERVSSPVTQELEPCDASWRHEPRNAPHGCKKPQRS